jgi:hypothetical protein
MREKINFQTSTHIQYENILDKNYKLNSVVSDDELENRKKDDERWIQTS